MLRFYDIVVYSACPYFLELAKSISVDLPERNDDNPEIERMWAWKRIDGLLKSADRTGSRDSVISEIVSLGETYSIVTEYTSFLVLENDAEYKRWKIERRNVSRIGRDRQSQQKLRESLEQIRNKASADLGPDPVGPPSDRVAWIKAPTGSAHSRALRSSHRSSTVN